MLFEQGGAFGSRLVDIRHVGLHQLVHVVVAEHPHHRGIRFEDASFLRRSVNSEGGALDEKAVFRFRGAQAFFRVLLPRDVTRDGMNGRNAGAVVHELYVLANPHGLAVFCQRREFKIRVRRQLRELREVDPFRLVAIVVADQRQEVPAQ